MQQGASEVDISTTIDHLELMGIFSERRYVDGFIGARRARFGSRKILFQLKRKGVCEEEIEYAERILSVEEEIVAREVLRKKFPSLAVDEIERSRQYRFLLGRGFNPDVITALLEN